MATMTRSAIKMLNPSKIEFIQQLLHNAVNLVYLGSIYWLLY